MIDIVESPTTNRVTWPEQRSHRGALVQWSQIVPVRSAWQIRALLGVLTLANLPRDWDSYGSPPPLPQAITAGISLLDMIDVDDLTVPHVLPAAGGGIQFEWNVNARELELEILPNGAVEYLRWEDGRCVDEGKLTWRTPGQLQSLLGWLTGG